MNRAVKGRKKILALSLALIVALIVPQAAFAGGEGEQEAVADTLSAVEPLGVGDADTATTWENLGGGAIR
jgi:hypothetical protein